jgi:hypothetical protein
MQQLYRKTRVSSIVAALQPRNRFDPEEEAKADEGGGSVSEACG